MDRKGWTGSFALLLAAMIWGGSFVAQTKGLEVMPPIAYNGIRLLIGAAVLFPVALLRRKMQTNRLPPLRRKDLVGSMICGVLLAVASNVQQFGLLYTTAGKSAFVTTLYVVFVPLIGLFFRKRIGVRGWIGTVMAAVGLFFLCVTESFSINRGDMITLLCALFFAFHILAVDRYSLDMDGIELSMIQFFTAGVICMVYVAFAERFTLSQIISCGVFLFRFSQDRIIQDRVCLNWIFPFRFFLFRFLWLLQYRVFYGSQLSIEITDALTHHISMILQLTHSGTNAVNAVFADMSKTLCGVVPFFRQGKHERKQSLCFQGKLRISEVMICHDRIIPCLFHSEYCHFGFLHFQAYKKALRMERLT